MINFVRTAFNGCMSFANVNGHLSEAIYIGRGLHQGSPLSPVLFLLIAQVFTKNMENNPAVEGISVEKVPLLQSLFADDTDIFLAASEENVRAVLRELEEFGNLSGCRYNIDKTCCIMLGQAKKDENLIQNLRRSYGQGFVPDDANCKALGINFDGSNLNNTVINNYSSKLEKVKNLIKIWANRNLTIYGRITLIKCFLISQFVYLISPLPSPENNIIKTINGILYKFLWGGGREKLKRELINKPKK